MSVSRLQVLPRGFGRDSRGAGAVEFALVLPMFVAIIFGLIQFGWAQHCGSSLRYALEYASRVLLLNPTMNQAGVRAVVQSRLQGTADTNVTVTMTVNTDANGAKTAVLVGNYVSSVGVPTLISYPINYSATVTTPLP